MILKEVLKAKLIKIKAKNHYRQWRDVVGHTALVYIGLAAQCTSKSKILGDQLNFEKTLSLGMLIYDLRYDQIEIWLVTLLFSLRTNLLTETLNRQVWTAEKSSRIEYRKVPDESSSIANIYVYVFTATSPASHPSPTSPQSYCPGCYWKSVRQTIPTHVAFNKPLDLNMNRVKTGENEEYPRRADR